MRKKERKATKNMLRLVIWEFECGLHVLAGETNDDIICTYPCKAL